MKLQDFKIVKNKQIPNIIYAYVKYNSNKTEKYSIFTMDGGKTFLASITSKNNAGKLVDSDYTKTFNNKEDALDGIISFLNKN